MTTKTLPRGLELAYHDELFKYESLASTEDERQAVAEARACLQANKLPDSHVQGILWKLSQKDLVNNRYGK